MEIARTRVNPNLSEQTPESGSVAPVPASGRRYGGVDKEVRQRQRRERLITAALEVFGEKGFHASTVRDVCRRAELTSRYFYESFDSMEALFEAVYAHVSRALMARVMLSLQTTALDPNLLAEAALRAFLEFIREDPIRARVVLVDAQYVGKGMHRVSQESNRDFAAIIAQLSLTFFPDLPRTGLDPSIVANGLVGAQVRIATQWVEDGCKAPLDAILLNLVSFIRASVLYAQTLVPSKIPHD